MIPLLPIVFVRRTEGPRGRGVRMLGYAQLPHSVVEIEACAAAVGYQTRTRVVRQGRAERVLDLLTDATKKIARTRGEILR